jgi:hypothetical protein
VTTLDLDKIELQHGGHDAPPDGTNPADIAMCVMEAVAYVAGEPWSDHPKCASPMLTEFLIRLNDRLSHENRQLLKPYIVRLVETNTGLADEETRKWMLRDWLVHEWGAARLRAAGMIEEAEQFEQLGAITGPAEWAAARETIYSVRAAARTL